MLISNLILALNLLAASPDPPLPVCPILAEELDAYTIRVKKEIKDKFPGSKVKTQIGTIGCANNFLIAEMYLHISDEKHYTASKAVLRFDLMPTGKIPVTVLDLRPIQ
jgi:hypothetical protein